MLFLHMELEVSTKVNCKDVPISTTRWNQFPSFAHLQLNPPPLLCQRHCGIDNGFYLGWCLLIPHWTPRGSFYDLELILPSQLGLTALKQMYFILIAVHYTIVSTVLNGACNDSPHIGVSIHHTLTPQDTQVTCSHCQKQFPYALYTYDVIERKGRPALILSITSRWIPLKMAHSAILVISSCYSCLLSGWRKLFFTRHAGKKTSLSNISCFTTIVLEASLCYC